MAGNTGFEPVTHRLTVYCSASELIPLKMAHPIGLEPMTYGLEGRCCYPTELRV